MVDLLVAEAQESLLGEGAVRTVYDPTAGSGGMLSVAEEPLHERNPSARLTLYGQEINGHSYAICKPDMISKGQDIGNILKGGKLTHDQFYRRTVDFCLSNPPYGDWKAAEEYVKEVHRGPPSGRIPLRALRRRVRARRVLAVPGTLDPFGGLQRGAQAGGEEGLGRGWRLTAYRSVLCGERRATLRDPQTRAPSSR